jgi:hypothetical protein
MNKGYVFYELIIIILLISSFLILIPTKMIKSDTQIAENFVENLRNDIYFTKLQSSTNTGVYRIRFYLSDHFYIIINARGTVIKKVVYDEDLGIVNQLYSSQIEIYYGTVTYPGTLYITYGDYTLRLNIKEMSGLIEVIEQ